MFLPKTFPLPSQRRPGSSTVEALPLRTVRSWVSFALFDLIRKPAPDFPGLATQPDVDGFLVGGASLKPEFVDIINARQS
jgi:hypothetical protein